MLLENLSYLEVDKYLEENDTILIPVGSVEQHSPYGLLGTDFIAAECVARKTAQNMGLLVAPTLSYGISPHHMGFAGSVTLKPRTLILMIRDIVTSMVSHGFRRVIFINGHGGNVSTVRTALEELKSEGSKGCFDIISWYDFPELEKLGKSYFDDGEGSHATPSEVSVTRYDRPYAFEGKPVHEQDVLRPNHYWPLTKEEFKKIFPDGRMASAPWLATKEKGKKILDTASLSLEKKLREILEYDLVQ